MTTEELQKLDQNASPAQANAPRQMTMEEEDDFLRELRVLAGMEEAVPAAPVAAAAPGKAERPAQPQQAVPVQQTPVRQQPVVATNPPQQAKKPAPEYLVEPREARVAGWVKGVLLLGASAAMLVGMVLVVLNGLQAL